MRETLRGLRDEEGVGSLSGLFDCVRRLRVKKERGAITNMNVDVFERCRECSWLSRDGLDHIMGIPISPNYASTTRKYPCANYDRHARKKVKKDERPPDTVDRLGAKTGVTKISPPIKN